ncbi:Uncharacterised protein [Mycobacterium tuberculosis]|nr:Uncharacterised protein [Mycobacterium tuberculosis]
MAASNAFPMAVALLLFWSISPKVPDMVLIMLSIMVRMVFMISIIGGNWTRNWGSRASSRSRSVTRFCS